MRLEDTVLELGVPLEAAEQSQPRPGIRRGLSNQNVGIPCDSGTVHNTDYKSVTGR